MTKPRYPTDSSTSRERERPPSLELAYTAFRATAPSDMEVQRAVRRLKVRLQQPPRRRVRPAPFLAAALVGVGALAYAATALKEPTTTPALQMAPSQIKGSRYAGEDAKRSANVAPESGPSTAAAPQKPGSSGLAALPAERVDDAPQGERSTVPVRDAPSRPRKSAVQTTDRAKRALPPTESASWGEVSRAMATKDYAGAEQALDRLAHQGDATTRVNARLGQAQLALGRGDCGRARALAGEVRASGANAATKRRAEDIVARCASQRQ